MGAEGAGRSRKLDRPQRDGGGAGPRTASSPMASSLRAPAPSSFSTVTGELPPSHGCRRHEHAEMRCKIHLVALVDHLVALVAGPTQAAAAVAPDPSRLPLSGFFPPSPQSVDPFVVLPRAFAAALDLFPALAGRVARDGHIVVLDAGAAVPLVLTANSALLSVANGPTLALQATRSRAAASRSGGTSTASRSGGSILCRYIGVQFDCSSVVRGSLASRLRVAGDVKVPSMRQLHLHIISQDFNSTGSSIMMD